MNTCKICNESFQNHSILANHVRWTHKKHLFLVSCKFCGKKLNSPNLVSHENFCQKEKNKCNVCSELTLNEKFCSRSCAAIFNNKTKKIGYAIYRKKRNIQKQISYREICFQYWDPKCADCGWDLSVEVHHIDGNHENNDFRNLVPLCANHHIKTRMLKFRDSYQIELRKLVEEKFKIIT